MSHETVWERALVHLGHTGEVVSEYSTPEGDAQIILSRCYDAAIEVALGLNDWDFARRRVRPTNLTSTNAPSPEWTYTWSLPTDLVRVRGFTIQRPRTQADRVQYEISASISSPATKVMYTREDPFGSTHYMIYTARILDDAQFSKQFEVVLAAVLAAEASLPMSKSLQFQEAMMAFATKRSLEGHEIVSNHEQEVRQVSATELARD